MNHSVILGGAIGDALGVFAESKPPTYQPLLNWNGKDYLGSVYHKLKPGQFSDDSEMSIMVAESLIDNNGFNPDDLAKKYIHWIASGEARGYGKTTYNAIQALISGTHWSKSGVVGSFGNGTAMRAAPFGVFFRNDIKSLIEAVKIDSAITHASEDAEAGAIAIALTAAWAANREVDDLLNRLVDHLPDSKLKGIICSLDALVDNIFITPRNALTMLGTKADVKQTVPAALYCFIRCFNYHDGIETAIRGGFDTDTTASIVGALFGARGGLKCIPEEFISGVERSKYLIELDKKLSQ